MQSNPSGTPKPPMYADAPSSLVIYAAQSPTEYLAYVMKFPYLKNAYLRRAKTYVSPYSPGGGFTQAWMPNISNSGPPTAMAPNQGGPMPSQPHYHGQQPSSDVPTRHGTHVSTHRRDTKVGTNAQATRHVHWTFDSTFRDRRSTAGSAPVLCIPIIAVQHVVRHSQEHTNCSQPHASAAPTA
jgi:hypothetical protein